MVVVLFKVVVFGVEVSLCRERLVFLIFPGKRRRYDDVDVDGGVFFSAVRRVDDTHCEFEGVFEKKDDDDVEFFSTRARDYWKEKYLEKNGTPRKGVRLCESKSRRRRRLRPNGGFVRRFQTDAVVFWFRRTGAEREREGIPNYRASISEDTEGVFREIYGEVIDVRGDFDGDNVERRVGCVGNLAVYCVLFASMDCIRVRGWDSGDWVLGCRARVWARSVFG